MKPSPLPPEEVLFHHLMLQCGITDLFPVWLNGRLERENPLSELTLELSFCGDDLNSILSCLKGYLWEQPADEATVAEMIRLECRKRFSEGKLSQKECVDLLCGAAIRSEHPYHPPWSPMYRLAVYHEELEDGFLDRDIFDKYFLAYLNNGNFSPEDPRSQ